MTASVYSQATGEGTCVLLPQGYAHDGTKRGVVFCHGNTADATQTIGQTPAPSQPGTARLLKAIADAGFPVIGCDFGGNNWGNQASVALVAAAVTYLQGPDVNAKAGTVLLVGQSMGNATAMVYALNYPSKVAGILGAIPVSDINDIEVNNRGGNASYINAAYGGAWSQATYGAAHNPTTFAGSLTGIPIKLWYANDDAVVLPSTVTTLAGECGAVTVNLGNVGGHGDGAVGSVPTQDAIDWLVSYS